VGESQAWKAAQVQDDELKDLNELAAAINGRMDALVAHAESLRRLLEEVGATHHTVVAQLAEAQRHGIERAIAMRTGAVPGEPLGEPKPRKGRSREKRDRASARRKDSTDRATDRAAGSRGNGRGVVSFERRPRAHTT